MGLGHILMQSKLHFPAGGRACISSISVVPFHSSLLIISCISADSEAISITENSSDSLFAMPRREEPEEQVVLLENTVKAL